jgi:hypothetical protein
MMTMLVTPLGMLPAALSYWIGFPTAGRPAYRSIAVAAVGAALDPAMPGPLFPEEALVVGRADEFMI